ncbi:MAG: ABC transporter, ATP-binding protein (cluster 13, osmolytes) [Ktedonobacterales bacterium]|jgi:osmoprotectant transport system ATP-binding protein|nr:MAG: ABC transporter, ATP-binding protein (cluster 13, osmolytes) [Ktedonobacterales bacterium]
MATIEFVDVTKEYPNAKTPAVDNVSFTVHEGAICMLLGTSGSGKTTLLRMVNRLIDPTSGEIRIDGVPTTQQDPIALRRSIGYVIQQVGLFPHLSIEDNVRVVPSILGKSAAETRDRVDELLHLVGLEPAEYRKRYPRQLSGGQQQRVGLARALAADPAVLLMDEPFGALDAITRARLQDELLNVQRGVRKTILFVTHDVEEAFKLGDQIVVMSEGKLVQEGSPIELLAQPASDFVRQLVGADNILRQFEYQPVTAALEPATDAAQERIAADERLLPALLRLIQMRNGALAVVRDGETLGQVSLASVFASVQSIHRNASAASGEHNRSADSAPVIR